MEIGLLGMVIRNDPNDVTAETVLGPAEDVLRPAEEILGPAGKESKMRGLGGWLIHGSAKDIASLSWGGMAASAALFDMLYKIDVLADKYTSNIGLTRQADKDNVFLKVSKALNENADYWEGVMREEGATGVDRAFGMAVGGFAPGLVEWVAGVPYAALAGAGAAEARDESVIKGAAAGGIKRALLGQFLKYFTLIKNPVIRRGLGATMGAGVAAIEGAPIEDVAAQGLLMGALSERRTAEALPIATKGKEGAEPKIALPAKGISKGEIPAAIKPQAELAEPKYASYSDMLKIPQSAKVVEEHAKLGVKAAKDAIIESKSKGGASDVDVEAGDIAALSDAPDLRAGILKKAFIDHGLSKDAFDRFCKEASGGADIDSITLNEGLELYHRLTDLDYMNTWGDKIANAAKSMLIDTNMTAKEMKAIRLKAGSDEAYNRVINYSNALGGVPTDPSIPDLAGRRAAWLNDLHTMAVYAREGQKHFGSYIKGFTAYQTIPHILDKIERSSGVPLRRAYSDMVIAIQKRFHAIRQTGVDAVKRAGLTQFGRVVNPVECTKIARWLNEVDPIRKLNMWNDMSEPTQRLANECVPLLQSNPNTPTFPDGASLVRMCRFLKWNKSTQEGIDLRNKISSEGRDPTEAEIRKIDELMNENRPPDATLLDLHNAREAQSEGKLFEHLHTVTWGTQKNYFMNPRALEALLDLPEGSIHERVFEELPIELGEFKEGLPPEAHTRKGKHALVVSNNIMIDIMRHNQRLAAYIETFGKKEAFAARLREAGVSKNDMALFRDADMAMRGVFPRSLPIIHTINRLSRNFWRGYLVLRPLGSLYYGIRNLFQVCLLPTQVNMTEFLESFHALFDRPGTIDLWLKNNPNAADGFKAYYESAIMEGPARQNFLMHSEDASESKIFQKLGWTNNVAAFLDMLAFSPQVTDRATRGGPWPIVYDIANRNVNLFHSGRINQKQLWKRLALYTVSESQSLELQSMLNKGDYANFMNKYTEYKIENFNGRYLPALRGIQETTPTGRALIGLIVYPRVISNIIVKNALEPIAEAADRWSPRNSRKAYEGVKVLCKLAAGATVADCIYYKITGRHAYHMADMLAFNLGTPGLGIAYDLVDSSNQIIMSNEQKDVPPMKTAIQLARNASNQLEIFIPLSDIMISQYEMQRDVDGVRMWSMARDVAIYSWNKTHAEKFTPRSRTWFDKVRYSLFGREPPLKLTPQEKALRDYAGKYGKRGDSWYREYKPKED